MATTSLQYCCYSSPGYGDNEVEVLCRKLNFLKSLLEEEATGVGAAAMKSLSDDVDSLCLVKECCELESTYGTRFTK